VRRPRPRKPPLTLQTTTLWEYPSQHYGDEIQGSQKYVGATPSWVIWNVLQRYSQPDGLVVDPFCGSGTTLDVARDTGRRARGFDLTPARADVEEADARKLPLESGSADVVFMDPPYGDHIHYSDDPKCIGKLSAYGPEYVREMGRAIREGVRVLVPGGVLAVYCCDVWDARRGFAPVGLQLLAQMADVVDLVDVVSVVRHNKTLEMGNYHKAARDQNFYLRGFNYLLLGRKPAASRGGASAQVHRHRRR
jgi:DNA modification methylase